MSHPCSFENIVILQKQYAPSANINKDNIKVIQQFVILCLTLFRGGKYTQEDYNLYGESLGIIDISTRGNLVENIDNKDIYEILVNKLLIKILKNLNMICLETNIQNINTITAYVSIIIDDEFYNMHKDILPPRNLFSVIENKFDTVAIQAVMDIFIKKYDIEVICVMTSLINYIYSTFENETSMIMWMDNLENNHKDYKEPLNRLIVEIVNIINNELPNLDIKINLILFIGALMKNKVLMDKLQ